MMRKKTMKTLPNIDDEALSEVMMLSLKRFCESDKKSKSLYLKLEEKTIYMIAIILGELDTYEPGFLWTWWCYPKNHMRFRDIKQIQKTPAFELLHYFLKKFSRGELENDVKEKKKKRKTVPKSA